MDSFKLTTKLFDSPRSKKDTPSLIEKDFEATTGSLVKMPQNLVELYDRKMGKKLHFSLKVLKVSKKPFTIPATKMLPTEIGHCSNST